MVTDDTDVYEDELGQAYRITRIDEEATEEAEPDDFSDILASLNDVADPPPPLDPLTEAQQKTAELRVQLEEAEASPYSQGEGAERFEKIARLRDALGRAVLGESFADMDDDAVAATEHELALKLEAAKAKRDATHLPLAKKDAIAEVKRLRKEWAAAMTEGQFRRKEALDAKMQAQIDGWQEQRAKLHETADRAAAQVASIQESLKAARQSGDVEGELNLIRDLAEAQGIATRTRKEAQAPLIKVPLS